MPITLITKTPTFIAEREAYLREKEEARKNNPFPSPRVIDVPKPKPNALPSSVALPSPYSVKKILEQQAMRDIEEEDRKINEAYGKKLNEEADKITNAFYAAKQKRIIKAFVKAAKQETVDQNVIRFKAKIGTMIEGEYIRFINYNQTEFRYVKKENAQYIMSNEYELFDLKTKKIIGRFDMEIMRIIPITKKIAKQEAFKLEYNKMFFRKPMYPESSVYDTRPLGGGAAPPLW